MGTWGFVASAGDAETDAVRAASPLASRLMLQCGPVRVPIGVAAAEAALEAQDSEPARVLWSFLRANPWEGMGSVTSTGWLLLARDDETMVFAQRSAPLGLGPWLTTSRRDVDGSLGSVFRPRNMGGCRPVLATGQDGLDQGPPHREQPELSFAAWVDARTPMTVRLWWHASQTMSRVAHRVHARTEVLETEQEVHFLLISAPNPAYRPPPPGFFEDGTGGTVETTVELTAPLGARHLISDYGVPPTPISVHRDDTDRA